MSKVLIDI